MEIRGLTKVEIKVKKILSFTEYLPYASYLFFISSSQQLSEEQVSSTSFRS